MLHRENYFSSNPLLVIFHDPPEAMGFPDMITNKLELHNTWLVSYLALDGMLDMTPTDIFIKTDVSKTYVEWAIGNKFAVIDVNIPKHITESDDKGEQEDSDSHIRRTEATKELTTYLWDNYIDMADATHIILMGIGDAYYGIVALLRKHSKAHGRRYVSMQC